MIELINKNNKQVDVYQEHGEWYDSDNNIQIIPSTIENIVKIMSDSISDVHYYYISKNEILKEKISIDNSLTIRSYIDGFIHEKKIEAKLNGIDVEYIHFSFSELIIEIGDKFK